MMMTGCVWSEPGMWLCPGTQLSPTMTRRQKKEKMEGAWFQRFSSVWPGIGPPGLLSPHCACPWAALPHPAPGLSGAAVESPYPPWCPPGRGAGSGPPTMWVVAEGLMKWAAGAWVAEVGEEEGPPYSSPN